MTDPSTPRTPTPTAQEPMDYITRVVQRIAELPDRASLDEWPEAMLVTADELRDILTSESAPTLQPEALRALLDQHLRSAQALEFGADKLLTDWHAERARFAARLHRAFASELEALLHAGTTTEPTKKGE